MEFLKQEDLSIEQKIGMVLCARRFRENDMVNEKGSPVWTTFFDR